MTKGTGGEEVGPRRAAPLYGREDSDRVRIVHPSAEPARRCTQLQWRNGVPLAEIGMLSALWIAVIAVSMKRVDPGR